MARAIDSFQVYEGQVLRNVLVTRKLDGVQARRQADGSVLSRAYKPLHNLTLHCDIAEIYCGSWDATVSRVRTHNSSPIEPEFVYELSPEVDPRLVVGYYGFLAASEIRELFLREKAAGFEGLVLRSGDEYYKVKDKQTLDLPVTGVSYGGGKHLGRMGALYTPKGRVGTGFTDAQRERDWKVGEIIEVEYMQLTPAGKMRHARFLRLREDKC